MKKTQEVIKNVRNAIKSFLHFILLALAYGWVIRMVAVGKSNMESFIFIICLFIIAKYIDNNFEKSISSLEDRISDSNEMSGIYRIDEFNLFFYPIFLKRLREKCGFDEQTLKNIDHALNGSIETKIEFHSSGLFRIKQWHRFRNDKFSYSEKDNPSPHYFQTIYSLKLSDFYSKEDKSKFMKEEFESEYLECSWWFHEPYKIKVFLSGGRFGGCLLPDDEFMPKEEYVLTEIELKTLNQQPLLFSDKLPKYQKKTKIAEFNSEYNEEKGTPPWLKIIKAEDGIGWHLRRFDST